MRKYTVLLLAVLSLHVSANEYDPFSDHDYLCNVKQAYDLSSDGTYEKGTKIEKDALGKVFTVKRETGVITGYMRNDFHADPKVLAIGSDENSFHAISMKSHENGNASVYYLTVREFEQGDVKPFKYVIDTITLTGTCTHF
jgi:hypothetical protein